MSMVLDQYIEITPDVRSGRPRIAGTGFTIADLAIRHLTVSAFISTKTLIPTSPSPPPIWCRCDDNGRGAAADTR